MVATTVLPPRPASPLEVEAWIVKLPLPLKFAVGVNFSPAFPSAKVMNVPLVICVVPSFWYSVPLVMPVILKCVTSAPSAALREITSPLVVCVSSLVVALVTDGVSATGLTVIVAFAVLPPRPASPLDVEAWIVKLPLPKKSAVGVNFSPALPFGEGDERAVGDLRHAVVLGTACRC